MCGENLLLVDQVFLTIGSPPRVRGKQINEKTFKVTGRITPACAGKTSGGLKREVERKDHPRVCGENGANMNFENRREGSPPRVRGKPQHFPLMPYRLGITPACAGKTNVPQKFIRFVQDHPRVCGENIEFGSPPIVAEGSPPRVRGKPYASGQVDTVTRITPACAGKTTYCNVARKETRDHPRVCGENRETLCEKRLI